LHSLFDDSADPAANSTSILAEWQHLNEAAGQFRDLASWNWLYEDQLFAIVNPEDGEVGYCSVMGASGEFCALSVYRGNEGLLSFERMKQDADEDANSRIDTDTYLNQKSRMASFEGREDVDKRDRAVFQSLALLLESRMARHALL
jgi:hypothetical protein